MDPSQLNRPWIDSPFFERQLAESSYDEETRKSIRSYADDGFFIVDPEIPDFDEVASDVIARCPELTELAAFGLAKRLELTIRRSEGAKTLLRRLGLVKALKRAMESFR